MRDKKIREASTTQQDTTGFICQKQAVTLLEKRTQVSDVINYI
jgi:hypothetical protein